MKLGNSFVVLCIILYYIGDIIKYYTNMYIEERKRIIKFFSKENVKDKTQAKEEERRYD